MRNSMSLNFFPNKYNVVNNYHPPLHLPVPCPPLHKVIVLIKWDQA